MKLLLVAILSVVLLVACLPGDPSATPLPTKEPPKPTTTPVPAPPTPTPIQTQLPPITPIGRWSALAECQSFDCTVYADMNLTEPVGTLADGQQVNVLDVRKNKNGSLVCYVQDTGWAGCDVLDTVCGYCDGVCLPEPEYYECAEKDGKLG